MAKQTEVMIKGKDNLSAVTKLSNLSEAGPSPSVTEPEDVDGREAARVLHSLQKLTFLKIIFLDIGISLGDVVTDLLQGLSLILEPDWSLAPTYDYGLLVVVTCWLPGPLTILHLCLQHRGLAWLPYRGLPGLLLLPLLLLLFPILPPSSMWVSCSPRGDCPTAVRSRDPPSTWRRGRGRSRPSLGSLSPPSKS